MSSILGSLTKVANAPKYNGRTIKLREPIPVTVNPWFNEELSMDNTELPMWMQALNDQLHERRNALAKLVMVLADKFNGDDWLLVEYSPHSGVQLQHKETGLYISAGTISANVSLENKTAVSLNVTMRGSGTQMNLVAGAINYLCINVVNHHLDKKLALAEQGEFTFDYQEEELKEKAAITSQQVITRNALFNSQVTKFEAELLAQKALFAQPRK